MSKITIIATVVVGIAIILGILYYEFNLNNTLNQQQSTELLNSRFNVTNIMISSGNSTKIYHAYLAITPQQQAEGYMNVSAIGDCGGLGNCVGMVFVFPSYGSQCFWMKNTALRLKQTWLDADGSPVSVYNATPYSQVVRCGYGQYVVETLTNFTINGTMTFGR